MLIEQQIAERQARASSAVTRVLERPASGEYGDYKIKSSSGRSYRVALRGPGLFDNSALARTLPSTRWEPASISRQCWRGCQGRRRKTLETAEYKRKRASISLKYGDTIEVWLRLPAAPSQDLLALAAQYFDPSGLLLRAHYRQFSEVLAAIQKADDQGDRLQRCSGIYLTAKTSWPKALSWSASCWRS